jgi:hypothetical protein
LIEVVPTDVGPVQFPPPFVLRQSQMSPVWLFVITM